MPDFVPAKTHSFPLAMSSEIEDPSAEPLSRGMKNSSQIAAFGMGCFWKTEALFGSLKGVVQTCPVYAGGSSNHKACYWQMADYIESVLIAYDPAQITFQGLLTTFFGNHHVLKAPWKYKYSSVVYYQSQEEKKLISQTIEALETQQNQKLHTRVMPLVNTHLTEERHLKYKLQQNKALLSLLRPYFPDYNSLLLSELATKLNSCLYGYPLPDDWGNLITIPNLKPEELICLIDEISQFLCLSTANYTIQKL